MQMRWWLACVGWLVLAASGASAQDLKSYLESDFRYAIAGKEGTESGVINRFENTLGMATYLEGDFLAAAIAGSTARSDPALSRQSSMT